MLSRLAPAFFARPSATVARELLGTFIVQTEGPTTKIARVVEVEAYLGQQDAASHARRGPTPRAAIMFGPPAHLYVYLVYGMHHCLNVVTESDGVAGAVLIRAAEPVRGFAIADQKERAIWRALAGPGKLCAGLEITRRHNGMNLGDSPLYFANDAEAPPVTQVGVSARIGVAYAGAWAKRKLRFYLRGNPSVSVRPND